MSKRRWSVSTYLNLIDLSRKWMDCKRLITKRFAKIEVLTLIQLDIRLKQTYVSNTCLIFVLAQFQAQRHSYNPKIGTKAATAVLER